MRHVLALLLALAVLLPSPASAGNPVRIMALGDSITAARHDPEHGGWRARFKARADAAGYQIDMVGSQQFGPFADNDHEGHPGWTAGMLDAQITGWVQAYQPDMVLLQGGTVNLAFGQTTEQTTAEVMALVSHIHAVRPATAVLVSTLTPWKGDQAKASAVNAVNSRLPILVHNYRTATGRDARFVNVGGTITTDDICDDVHPCPSGHVKLGDAWFSVVQGILSTPAATPCSPRPPVRVVATPTQSGLSVTITAPSSVQGITTGTTRNAAVSPSIVNGPQASFTVTRSAPGAWHVPFTVTDQCGPWTTFVGSGS